MEGRATKSATALWNTSAEDVEDESHGGRRKKYVLVHTQLKKTHTKTIASLLIRPLQCSHEKIRERSVLYLQSFEDE